MKADLRLTPSNPLASLYDPSALTDAGEEFLDVWYPNQLRINQADKKRFEIVAWALGLKVETKEWPRILGKAVDFED